MARTTASPAAVSPSHATPEATTAGGNSSDVLYVRDGDQALKPIGWFVRAQVANPPAWRIDTIAELIITAGWALQSNATGEQLGVTQLAVDVPVGEHVDITCQLSHNTSSDHACEGLAAVEVVDLVLTAAKLGQQKYREVKRFRVASSEGCPLTAGSVAIECTVA